MKYFAYMSVFFALGVSAHAADETVVTSTGSVVVKVTQLEDIFDMNNDKDMIELARLQGACEEMGSAARSRANMLKGSDEELSVNATLEARDVCTRTEGDYSECVAWDHFEDCTISAVLHSKTNRLAMNTVNYNKFIRDPSGKKINQTQALLAKNLTSNVIAQTVEEYSQHGKITQLIVRPLQK